MTIESALYEYLSTKASVTAMVNTRIYPQLAPESAVYPFLTYQIVSADHVHHMGGASGLVNDSVQIDVWTETPLARITIAEVIRNALDGFRGSMGSEQLHISNCFLQDRNDFTEPEIEGKQRPVFHRALDFSIWYIESIPTL